MSENKDMRELSLDEMDKVSGGSETTDRKYHNCKFYELDGSAQYLVTNGYCPNCDPQEIELAWNSFRKNTVSKCYYCLQCGLIIQYE